MNKIYHPYNVWECFKAGFYETKPPEGKSKDEAEQMYADFLGNLDSFEKALKRVLYEWPNSCEHFLSNESINRIAWLGQASMCIENRVPSIFKPGFRLLSKEKQDAANSMAAKYLHEWIDSKQGKLFND